MNVVVNLLTIPDKYSDRIPVPQCYRGDVDVRTEGELRENFTLQHPNRS